MTDQDELPPLRPHRVATAIDHLLQALRGCEFFDIHRERQLKGLLATM